jgi:hypothetical protein
MGGRSVAQDGAVAKRDLPEQKPPKEACHRRRKGTGK